MRAARCLLACACTLAGAAEVVLAAPCATQVEAPARVAGGRTVTAVLRVPADAPDDLGVGAWAGDAHGAWWGRPLPGRLGPGVHRLRIDLPAGVPIPGATAAWSAAEAAEAGRSGLYLWSARAWRGGIGIDELAVAPLAEADAPARLLDCDAPTCARTGERWELAVRPEPYPADPYDPAAFRLDLTVRGEDGGELALAGFHRLPEALSDAGDHEAAQAVGRAAFAVRWRPQRPGAYRLRLRAQWGDGRRAEAELPAVRVDGPPRDGVARRDPGDPRFLAVDGRFWWPLGPNLRSPGDERSRVHLGTVVTPNRGSLSYEAWFARFAAHGADAAEVWLSAWNLALEWDAARPGFHGAGRFSQANAARLDRVLDRAWAHGMRLLLALNNHGQASTWCDAEWERNPWNRANGGPLAEARELFTDPRALAGQERLRRYLAARYADHPAVLGWKLWTEQDLTDAGRPLGDDGVLRDWHAQALASWRRLDPYRHLLTTHWSTEYTQVYPRVAALEDLDVLTIDAYHRPAAEPGGRLLADLLYASSTHRTGLVERFAKGVLVTESGGSPIAAPEALLAADHASGPWAALVCGHLGAPMLWWAEWIDQGGRFAPYTALSRFLAGEDLRSRPGAEARSAALRVRGSAPDGFWCRAWVRQGLVLGYLLDRRWGGSGATTPLDGAVVEVAAQLAPCRLAIEWWDADSGALVARGERDHPGGALELAAPPFSRHLAFKLRRG